MDKGFSDTTGLTYTVTTNLDMATIYSYNFGTFGMKNWHRSLSDNSVYLRVKILSKTVMTCIRTYYKRVTGLEEFVLEKKVEWINLYPGKKDGAEIRIRGRMLGGCLDVLRCLAGPGLIKRRNLSKNIEMMELYGFGKLLLKQRGHDACPVAA